MPQSIVMPPDLVVGRLARTCCGPVFDITTTSTAISADGDEAVGDRKLRSRLRAQLQQIGNIDVSPFDTNHTSRGIRECRCDGMCHVWSSVHRCG